MTTSRLRRVVAAVTSITMLAALGPAAWAQESPEDRRPCTAVVTPMISTLRTVNDLGLDIGVALVPGLVGTGLALSGSPELTTQIQSTLNQTIYPQMFEVADQVRTQAGHGLTALDDILAVLSPGNEAADQGIEMFATALDQVVESYGDQIAPVDRTLTDLAAASRYFESGTCSA